jgi:hypothetical protein
MVYIYYLLEQYVVRMTATYARVNTRTHRRCGIRPLRFCCITFECLKIFLMRFHKFLESAISHILVVSALN